jgi:hypothetical protein
MGKRIVLILSAALILVLVTTGIFLRQGNKNSFTDPYTAVSSKAYIVIETRDVQSFLNALTTGKGLFGEISRIREFERFNNKLKFLADHMNDAAVREMTADKKAIIAFFSSGEGKTDLLLSMSAGREMNYRQISQAIASMGAKNISEVKINGRTILGIPFITYQGKDTAYISLGSGLFLLSSSKDAIKEAQSAERQDIRTSPGFSKVFASSGENEDKIFIVFRNLPELIKPLLAWSKKDISQQSARLAAASGCDIFLNDESIVLSGYTECNDSSGFLYRFKNSQVRELQAYKILPECTAFFETMSINSAYLKDDPPGEKKIQGNSSGLMEFAGNEVTRAYLDIRENKSDENKLIILELRDTSRAAQLLKNQGEAGLVSCFQPDDQTKIPVYRSSAKSINTLIPGNSSFDGEDSLYAFYDNYLIAGSSFRTISRFLYDNLLNNTLANDLVFRDFQSTLPSRASYFLFFKPAGILNCLDGFLNDDIVFSLRENKIPLSKIVAAGYQLAPSNGMLYNSFSIKFREDVEEESLTEWETLLDTTASIKPFFFTNHLTGAKEIFIQDLKNNAYLINAAGRILWKVPLREKISGNIFMIDYFRNGKYQLLFNGKTYLHLLDRNGNYVDRYPVKLRSPATNALALFDYDNNRNYRLFIAGEDRLIYSYDKEGNVVKGWKPFRTAGPVTAQLNYFQSSGKDYIAASDDRSMYLLDRSGNRRVNFNEAPARAKGSALKQHTGSSSYIICTSPEGTVQHIYFDGSVKKIILRKFSPDHTFDIFDIDGDGSDEYIFIDRGILYLYKDNGTELFSKSFGSQRIEPAGNFVFGSNERKTGIIDMNRNLIYLLNEKGGVEKGFPLKGASMFSIGRLTEKGGWNLIVGSPDRFLYNYKLITGIN